MTYQKQLVKAKTFNDKRQKSLEKKADGYRTAVVTNNVKEASGGWRALLPVDELFDVVVDSSAVGVRKPDPAIFAIALEQLGGVPPSACRVVQNSAPSLGANWNSRGSTPMIVCAVPDSITLVPTTCRSPPKRSCQVR